MKKVISIVLSLVLAVGLLSLPSASAAALANAKITDELSAAITKDGSAKAFVTMNDVDHAKVMKTFMTEYPAEFEAYTQAKFDVAASSGIEITDELVQSAVERKREIYREYYTAANQAVISACVASKNVTFVSAYSPIAIVEVNRTEALQLAKNANIRSLEIAPASTHSAADRSSEDYYGEYPFRTLINVLDLTNATSGAQTVREYYQLTGSGVKIGLFEAYGLPDVSNSYLQDAAIYCRSIETEPDNHATLVAAIIVGQKDGKYHGVAPDSELYCCSTIKSEIDNDDYYTPVEWLINQGVNIINSTVTVNIHGYYSPYDAWIDHIAVMHDIHFVSSAGNFNPNYGIDPLPKVQTTGMSYNAITVGAMDAVFGQSATEAEMYEKSAYMEDVGSDPTRTILEKPNIVANGSFAPPIPSDENSDGLKGTSFAAPQVAGVIAQLCSYNWELKFKQTAVGAILMASAAEKVEAVGNGTLGDSFASSVRVEGNEQVSDKEGAGALNALYAYNIVANGNYWSPTVYAASFPYTKTVTVQSNNTYICRVAIFWLSRVSVSNHTSGANSVTPMANLNLVVKDPNGNIVGTSSLTYANFEIVQFEPTETGTYQFIISGSSTEKEYIGIALSNEVM